ncbi:peptidoglycan-binding protein [Rhizobium leguminosarum]|uniref:peptidoglycan-binding protein n=1 Tax=Rhizobium leguminosarum TaxID=384 RepID=UPI001AE8F8A0|nr:peptidoglycan-binding protein [Rhizobium leguminosarum]MBP2447523.1 localization factor PodJL [Rhizobium leguminosarum]
MNGSRSNPSRQSDRTSLDALNRTIEGLEARIEGLMGSGREQRPRTATAEREAYPASNAPRPARAPLEPRPDPLSEIRQRQRALEAGRERPYTREPAPQLREPLQRAAAPQPAPAFRAGDDTMTEIAQALVNLRHDLKRDISEGVTREMNALRAELREIKANAGDGGFADDMRADMGRLAQSITQLTGRSSGPEATGLREDFEELRSLMDGLAREDSLRHMENRWDGFESRLAALDTEGLQEELVSLAYRLDDIKRHIGGMGESPAVRALEDKLIAIATAMEQFGNMIQPHDRIMSEQFAAMDTRLDEISRAIAASGRAAATNDPALMQRLEGRLSALADQIDLMSHDAANRATPDDELAMRLEALTSRVEELTKAEATSRLDERLEHLSYLLERTHTTAQPDLTGALSDISRKIDALENGAVNDVLAQRLDGLARRIDEMADLQPAPVAAVDDGAFRRLEGRLSDIAARLEESTSAAPTDPHALKNLEDQIANLSALMNTPRESAAIPAEFDRRMGAIEDYMATSDEYIIEAARQAAEAVVDAYSRHGGPQGAVPAADMSALTALAEDLRHLEDISRDSEERTHKTFKALHETLVHIADRLDGMEERGGRVSAQMPVADVDFDVDPYALMVAEAEMDRTPAAALTAKASPVIRTAEVAAEPVAPAQANAMSGTSAIAIEAATRTQEAATHAPAKASLLASLGKRLLPGKKAESRATERPMIDPAPSIDPTDVVPTDAANELLEPGSGVPDVKKILERVRASQSAARGKPAAETDRADYIAAARRAAQAAAMEVDANPKQAAVKAEKKGASVDKAGKTDKSDKTGKTSAFSRYRRPILLAVGAVLLAIMAFPLARTLTSGESAPQAPAEVSALTGATENPPPVLPEPTPAQPDTGAAETAAPTAQTTPPAAEQAAPEATPPVAGDHLTDAAPLDGEGAATFAPAAPSGAAQETSGFVANTPAAASAPQSAITIPDTVQPKSLADAARSGDVLALFEIGARYSDGRNGIAVDQKQAAGWYQLSADKGFAPAQYRLGSMYEKGNGVERDIAKAKGFYEQAANQGNASAMHNLAVLYASGALGQQDYATAASWFTKAANLGITDSQFNLAILCARGNGVPADIEESYKWFSIAAKAGDKDAAQKRDEVAKAMKPDQLERARAKADLWKPEPVDHRTNAIDIPDEWAGTGLKTATVDMKKAIRNIQAILNNNGFDAGWPDGEMGAKTVTAIKNFQKSVGQEADGKVTDATVKALLERNKQVSKAI